jgi:cytochrome c oxidase subunit 1
LLPALGIASEVIATNAQPIFGYRAMIMSIIAIGFRLLCGASYVCFWYESILGSVFTLQHY